MTFDVSPPLHTAVAVLAWTTLAALLVLVSTLLHLRTHLGRAAVHDAVEITLSSH